MTCRETRECRQARWLEGSFVKPGILVGKRVALGPG